LYSLSLLTECAAAWPLTASMMHAGKYARRKRGGWKCVLAWLSPF